MIIGRFARGSGVDVGVLVAGTDVLVGVYVGEGVAVAVAVDVGVLVAVGGGSAGKS